MSGALGWGFGVDWALLSVSHPPAGWPEEVLVKQAMEQDRR